MMFMLFYLVPVLVSLVLSLFTVKALCGKVTVGSLLMCGLMSIAPVFNAVVIVCSISILLSHYQVSSKKLF